MIFTMQNKVFKSFFIIRGCVGGGEKVMKTLDEDLLKDDNLK